MIKRVLFLFLILIGSVSAIQDSFITVNNKNSDICFAVDDYTNVVCNGSIITVEGTKDNVLYIVPQTEITHKDNVTTQFTYIVTKPLNWLSGVVMFIGFIGFLISILIGVAYLLSFFTRL